MIRNEHRFLSVFQFISIFFLLISPYFDDSLTVKERKKEKINKQEKTKCEPIENCDERKLEKNRQKKNENENNEEEWLEKPQYRRNTCHNDLTLPRTTRSQTHT